jgi:hypothetical protein
MVYRISSFVLLVVFAFSSCAQVTTPSGSQGLGSVKNSSQPSSASQPASNTTSQSDPAADALKQALSLSAQKSSDLLSVTDGFFKNQAIKILMPPDAKLVEEKLRDFGFGAEVDNMILSMNRAAESAAKDAAPIFINAIEHMSINDAFSIVKGPNDAATQYLKKTTTPELTTKFRPVIQSALDKVDATKYWSEIFSTYNKIPFAKPVNSDLAGYVTQKALDGLFYTMSQQEAQIRKDPAGTANALIQQVFGKH